MGQTFLSARCAALSCGRQECLPHLGEKCGLADRFLVSKIAFRSERGGQVALFFATRFRRLVGLDANAIGAEAGEFLGLAVTVERLRKVRTVADVQNLVSMSALGPGSAAK